MAYQEDWLPPAPAQAREVDDWMPPAPAAPADVGSERGPSLIGNIDYAATHGAITGAGEMAAGIPRALAGAARLPEVAESNAQQFARQQLGAMTRIDNGEAVKASEDPLGYGDMSPEQRASMRDKFAAQVDAMPAPGTTGITKALRPVSGGLSQVADAIDSGAQGIAEKNFPVDPRLKDNLAVKTANIVGGSAPLVVGAVLGGLPGAAATAFTSGYEGGWKKAKGAGVDDGTAHQAAFADGLVSAGLMTLPAAQWLGALAPEARKPILNRVADAVANGATMIGISQAQQLAENITAQQTYAPQQDIRAGLGQGMAEQGIAGAVIPGVLGALAPHEDGKAAAAAPHDDWVPPAPTNPATMTESEGRAELEQIGGVPPQPQPAARATAPNQVPRAPAPQIERQIEQPKQASDMAAGAAGSIQVPAQYAGIIRDAAQRNGVPEQVLAWVGKQESNFNPAAVGIPTRAGRAAGMFQFMPGTAKELGIDPSDAAQAADGAARYLRQLYDKTGSWEGAVERYGTFSTGRGAEADAAVRDRFRSSIQQPVSAENSRPVFTGAGSRIETRPELIEADDLLTSHDEDGRPNPDYPDELQPRDRSSAASRAQIQEGASRLQPERLMPSPDASTGAPIVGPDGVVESGNGRVEMLRRVMREESLGTQREAYRQALDDAGYDTRGFTSPILISRRLTELDPGQLQQFTREANERGTLAMNAGEQARVDAGRAGNAIDLWRGSDAGSAANRDFVRSFMQQLPAEERGAMVLPDGGLSAEGQRRIQAAVTAHAYGAEMGPLLDRFLNTDAEGMKSIAGALSDAAGEWARVRSAAEKGGISQNLDATAALSEAVQTVARARQLGRPVAELVNQTDLDRPPMSPEAQAFTRAMFRDDAMRQPAARQVVADRLIRYANEAQKQSNGPDMLGNPPAQPAEIIRAVMRSPGGGEQPPIMNIEQFAAQRGGLTTDADVQSHIHAGLRSAPTTKTYARFNKRRLEELQAERDATAAAYRDAIARGEIRQPTDIERLEAAARGHPDLESTKAAQRVLAKRQASAAAQGSRGVGEGTHNYVLFDHEPIEILRKYATAASPAVAGTMGRVTAAPKAKAAAPAITSVKPQNPRGIVDDIQKVFSPTSRLGAKPMEYLIRRHAAEAAQSYQRAVHALETVRDAVDRLPRDAQLSLTEKMERGQKMPTPELQAAADALRSGLDQWAKEIRSLGRGYLEQARDNYMGHIWANYEKWKNGQAATQGATLRDQMMRGNSKSPIRGSGAFLKQRIFETQREGMDAGLEPVTANPIDMQLIKLREMQKFYHGTRMADEIKRTGIAKWVPWNERFDAIRSGQVELQDRIFHPYLPPAVATHFQTLDPQIRAGLEGVAKHLGIEIKTPIRNAALDRQSAKVGNTAVGYQKPGEIVSRFGASDTVLMHEIGHALDERYGLAARFSAQPEAWRELADLARMRDPNASDPQRIAYLQDPAERIANLVHAYWHAPELLDQVAPHAAALWRQFLNETPDIKALADKVKPSVQMSARTMEELFPGLRDMGAWYSPEPAARVFNNYVSPGLSGKSPLYDAIRMSGNALNQMQLGLSGFHASFVTMDTMVSRAALGVQQLMHGQVGEGAKNLIAGALPTSVVRSVRRGSQFRDAYLSPESATPEMQRLVEAFKTAGGRISMDTFYRSNAAGAFIKSMKDMRRLVTDPAFIGDQVRQMWGDAEGWQKALVPAKVGARAIETLSEPLMGYLVPRAKLGVWRDLAEDWLKQHPGSSPAETAAAMTKFQDSVDNRLGQMVYDNLFWNKTQKDLAFITARSVGWNLGTIRELGGGAVDAAKFAADLTRGKHPEFTTRMAYATALPFVVGLYGALITYMVTGEPPKERMDYFFPPDGKQGRLIIPSYIKDVMEYWHNPTQTLMNKTHPLISMAEQMLNNRDYYGGIIYSPEADNPVTAYAEYLLQQNMPFSLRSALRLRAEGGDMLTSALSFWGIQKAPASISQPERTEKFEMRDRMRALKKREKEQVRSGF